jgi:hypothetical protein
MAVSKAGTALTTPRDSSPVDTRSVSLSHPSAVTPSLCASGGSGRVKHRSAFQRTQPELTLVRDPATGILNAPDDDVAVRRPTGQELYTTRLESVMTGRQGEVCTLQAKPLGLTWPLGLHARVKIREVWCTHEFCTRGAHEPRSNTETWRGQGPEHNTCE